MRIYIIRHGETEWNKLGKWQGGVDTPLNSIGVSQVHRASKEFINRGIKKYIQVL